MVRISGGVHRNRQLKTPRGRNTRPTGSMFRETFFNLCRPWLEDSRVLDLFAGSGAIGLEALSRGASSVVCAERDRAAQQCLRENVRMLGVGDQVEIFAGDAMALLRSLAQRGLCFDLIYLDPPYHSPVEKYLEFIDLKSLLADEGVLFVERQKGKEAPRDTFSSFFLQEERNIGSSVLYRYRYRNGE